MIRTEDGLSKNIFSAYALDMRFCAIQLRRVYELQTRMTQSKNIEKNDTSRD
jgi:hypothetical protein